MNDDGTPEWPPCSDCTAYEENPEDYVESEICPVCPWGQEIEEQIIYKLMDFIGLQKAGCPIGRHELTTPEWKALGIVKSELERLAYNDLKEKTRGKT